VGDDDRVGGNNQIDFLKKQKIKSIESMREWGYLRPVLGNLEK
jgi:hypothetical protein